MTFVESFLFHRRYNPDAPAVLFPDAQTVPTSYAALDELTRAVSGRLRSAGIAQGDVVALDFSDELLHAVLLVSCARAGVVTMSGRPEEVAGQIAIKAIIRDKPFAISPAGGTATISIHADHSWLQPADHVGENEIRCPDPDDLCRIMLTSGSTGRPKGVALTYRMVDERIHAFGHAFGSEFPNHARLLSGMRLSSSLGFAFLFYLLARGGFYCADSVAFLKITTAIEEFGIGALVTTPFTLAELLTYRAAQSCSFPRLKLVMTAGSLLAPELARQVRTHLCERLIVFYGTTETGVVSTCWWEGGLGEVGTVVPGRQVELMGPEPPPYPPPQAGEGRVGAVQSGRIRVRASSGALPFFTLAELESRTRNDWFEPGDIGSFNADGQLVIEGREDGVINVGGTKTTPEVLEQTLLGAPGLQDCAVVCHRDGVGIDRIVAFLVLGPYWNQQAFQDHCQAHILRDFLPSKFVLLRQIPRNRNNKVDREALLKQIR
jgi:acyl-CoA synthetase (AMP-forming)/AMP-acid ligase II